MAAAPRNSIRVTPRHRIELADDIAPLIERPQEHDFVIRTLSRKLVNGQPLIQGDLVVAGRDTLAEFPLAKEYPVHFRKTYYPICFHQNPRGEFEAHELAARILDLPRPIGWTRRSFRSCFIPGQSYQDIARLNVDPPEQNARIAREKSVAERIGLWLQLEEIHRQTTHLHENGLVHGDLMLHNVIASLAPVGLHLIDFEKARRRDDTPSDEDWRKLVDLDLLEIRRYAVFLQCGLGLQEGTLAEESRREIPRLFNKPAPFLRALGLDPDNPE